MQANYLRQASIGGGASKSLSQLLAVVGMEEDVFDGDRDLESSQDVQDSLAHFLRLPNGLDAGDVQHYLPPLHALAVFALLFLLERRRKRSTKKKLLPTSGQQGGRVRVHGLTVN